MNCWSRNSLGKVQNTNMKVEYKNEGKILNTNTDHLVQGARLQGGEVPRLVRRVGDHVDGGEEGQQERRRKCSQD